MLDNQTKALARKCAQLKVLEAEVKLAKLDVLNDLKDLDLDSLQNDYGSFVITRRSKPVFTEAVTKLEEKVKMLKAEEIDKEIVGDDVTEFLTVKVWNTLKNNLKIGMSVK